MAKTTQAVNRSNKRRTTECVMGMVHQVMTMKVNTADNFLMELCWWENSESYGHF